MRGKTCLTAAVALGLACGSSKADVTYQLHDAFAEGTIDLAFTVANQLSPSNAQENFLSVGGPLAPYFTEAAASFTAPRDISFTDAQGYSGYFDLTNWGGAPGNGNFNGTGNVNAPGGGLPVAMLGEITVSGVPTGAGVPEPATWTLLSLGFVGLAAVAAARRRPRAAFLASSSSKGDA